MEIVPALPPHWGQLKSPSALRPSAICTGLACSAIPTASYLLLTPSAYPRNLLHSRRFCSCSLPHTLPCPTERFVSLAQWPCLAQKIPLTRTLRLSPTDVFDFNGYWAGNRIQRSADTWHLGGARDVKTHLIGAIETNGIIAENAA